MPDDRELERDDGNATRVGTGEWRGVGAKRCRLRSRVSRRAAAGSWFTGIVVARLLGADGAGEYAVASTFVDTLTAFSGSGVATGIAYDASRREWAPGDARRQVQLASGLFGLVGTTVAALAMLALRESCPRWTVDRSTLALLCCCSFRADMDLRHAPGAWTPCTRRGPLGRLCRRRPRCCLLCSSHRSTGSKEQSWHSCPLMRRQRLLPCCGCDGC